VRREPGSRRLRRPRVRRAVQGQLLGRSRHELGAPSAPPPTAAPIAPRRMGVRRGAVLVLAIAGSDTAIAVTK